VHGRRHPTQSWLFESLDLFQPDAHSVYVYAQSPEDRSAHSDAWEQRTQDVQFVRWISDSPTEVRLEAAGEEAVLPLRSRSALEAFWSGFDDRSAYLDITGFAHHVWAPLLRAALNTLEDVRVVYVEPLDYTQSLTPTEGEIFDLSERIRGVAPLPGFASLNRGEADEFFLLALLGFEGTRFAYVLENVQPQGDRVIPIVGVPGFRSEYPFYAYHGNRSPLMSTRSWTAVEYVTANCPFRVFWTLQGIEERVQAPVKIAPIGTKPHALGAILYAIHREGKVEIVYDHPVKTPKRTTGAARALVYNVRSLLEG